MAAARSRAPAGGGNGPIVDAGRVCIDLDNRPDAARVGRWFVESQVVERSAGLVDDAAIVIAELLANAKQHGRPPVSVCVTGAGARIRLEVSDGSPRSPVRPSSNPHNMTGRGMALVTAVSAQWGLEREAGGGKTVWAELELGRSAGEDDVDVDAILAAWDDEPAATAEPRFTVVLGDVPTDLLIEAKAHIDNVVREFLLASAAGEAGEADIPPHVADLIKTVVHGFGDARDAIKRQALAAAARGEPRTRLSLHLPASAADAGEAYLAALDEADNYSRAARLLTLETPVDHRLFRRWYVEAVVNQLRQLADGAIPEPVIGFEEMLVAEIRRLASAQRVNERAARLQRVTAALARSRTPEDVASVVLSEGVDALHASGGGLLVPASDSEHLAVPGVVGYGEELVGALREERRDALLPAATALRTGVPVWLESQEERDREFPALRGFEAATISMCAVPLIVGERSLGALRFSFNTRKLFDDDERAFVLALAAQTAQTLQRTELYEAERKAAIDLQRALLPAELPDIPGWRVATYYSPAGEQEAGGDFYDVLPVAGGRIAAIVGDVMGRGVEAAAAMAEIRSTIRAYAVDDPDPVSVFTRVDAFFANLDLDQLVTVLYFLVDPETGTVQIANAGHLPPLLIGPGGSQVIPTASGTPFGVGGFDREVVTVDLAPGTSLVAVTDGLVERRGEDIDEGVSRLLQQIEGASSWNASRILRHIVTTAAHERAHDDDVTVLVLQRI
jgi:serine phosphatase RsbU (regulator of sigma subunit)/anti-sigma regulatory factor (Ser/Thr protein kinase)